MPATSTVLTALSLTTSIAREGTDGVPIVKQVLGVASRIVGLAEQIDKNREDLHALAVRAKKIDATITAIVDDREISASLLCRLEDLKGVLCAVEKHFGDYIKHGRVRKTLGYIFTSRKEIDRLRGECDDRQLEVATNLDTNIFSRENSRFIGEFRNIRHCEITLLRPIAAVREKKGEDSGIFHLANCEGSSKVFVVRSVILAGQDEIRRRCIEDHNQILERLSLIQNRLPTIACLYGRNIGPKSNRFVVLEAGEVRPLDDALEGGKGDITVIGRLVAQLADVACHLRKHGAAWRAGFHFDPEIYVGNNYEPKIGIADDLCELGYYTAVGNALKLGKILRKVTAALHCQDGQFPRARHKSASWSNQLFGELVDAGYRTLCLENTVRRTDIGCLIPLSHQSWTFLHQHAIRPAVLPEWGPLLLRLAVGKVPIEGSFMAATYRADLTKERDYITVCCVEGDVDAIYHTESRFEIPRSAAEEARHRLGMPVGKEGLFLQRLASPGASSTVCTGWIEWDVGGSLW